MNHSDTLTSDSDTSDTFPADSLVRFTLGERHYIGRAHSTDRSRVVETVDAAGRSVSFSWPYICANASAVTPVNELDII